MRKLWFHHLPGVLAVLLALTACAQAQATPTLTPVPTSTPTAEPLPPTATVTTPSPDITEEATDEPIVLEITPLAGSADPPPLDITLPVGWEEGYDTFALFDIDTLRAVPLAVYQGPITGGTGTIVLMWGFPSLINANPFETETETPGDAPQIYVDGLRLFRLALVEAGCNPGTDVQRSYRIGTKAAVGTQFAIVDCPESPDTRGWFAGVQENGLNFVFFVYAEPIEVMDSAQDELQAILDSVAFRVVAAKATVEGSP